MLAVVTTAYGADRPIRSFDQRASIPARFAPVYSFPKSDAVNYAAPETEPQKTVLRGLAYRSNPDTVGMTSYDYQHNCTMGRQIEHRAMFSDPPDDQYGYYLHFLWMAQTNYILGGDRGIGYQAYEIGDCSFVFTSGGIRAEGSYAGYVSLDADPGGWGIPSAHQIEGPIYPPKAYWDYMPGGPAYGVFSSDATSDIYGWYENNGTGPGNENGWPKIDWDIDGEGDPVLHMVTAEYSDGTNPQTLSYNRRVGPYGYGNGVWSPQRVIDTVININVTVTSSPVSDKVAIIWNAPVDYKRDQASEFDNQYENDVWFAISNQRGADWADKEISTSLGFPSIGNTVDQGIGNPALAGTGGNVTTHSWEDDYKAYCDMSALITTNDVLNIVWSGRRWDDTTSLYRRQMSIFHWMEGDPLPSGGRPVVVAEWDTGGVCFAHSWSGDASKMTISECDGKLYVLYSQFGRRDNSCGDVDSDSSVVNGYLYMTVYDPFYGAWDRAQRVTNTAETPLGCTPGDEGDCNSEYWASMARFGRIDTCQFAGEEVLDILYINDKAPGGAMADESGVWTTNPVIWWTYPCREAVPEPTYEDDAGTGYGICYSDDMLTVVPGEETSLVFNIRNLGVIPNNITLTPSSDDPEVTVSAPVNMVIPVGATVPCSVTVAASVGATDPSTVEGLLTLTHEAEGSPRIVPMCVLVSSTYVELDSAIIATDCKRLKIYNNGQLSNGTANASLDFIDPLDPDDCASIYLYDGSPIICRDVGGEKRCFFTIYDNSYGSEHALRPLSPLLVDSEGNNSYTYATSEFITADSTMALRAHYYVPKHADSCSFVIEKLEFWNLSEVILTDVAIGEVLDWDIPMYEGGSSNESGTDPDRNLIYQYCCGHDECDTLAPCQRYGGIAAAADVGSLPDGFKNYFTLENDVYVYDTGPFGEQAPLPADTIYSLMSGNSGFNTATLDTCEDLTTLVTFGLYNIMPGTTYCVVKILSTSRNDADGTILKDNIDKANAFIEDHPEIKCELPPEPCDCIPGDANNDGTVNVGDAVYIIAYVFKGGPPPLPYETCSGDANGDCQCNIGDAVYIIAYVFKGGSDPVDCETWRVNCDTDIY
jgi:hypothetical protein